MGEEGGSTSLQEKPDASHRHATISAATGHGWGAAEALRQLVGLNPLKHLTTSPTTHDADRSESMHQAEVMAADTEMSLNQRQSIHQLMGTDLMGAGPSAALDEEAAVPNSKKLPSFNLMSALKQGSMANPFLNQGSYRQPRVSAIDYHYLSASDTLDTIEEAQQRLLILFKSEFW